MERVRAVDRVQKNNKNKNNNDKIISPLHQILAGTIIIQMIQKCIARWWKRRTGVIRTGETTTVSCYFSTHPVDGV